MRNIEIVSAGAGTGKTYNLTHRILGAVRAGTPADAVFAATFTRKAAAELSARLRQLLLARGERAAADMLSDGFVGTVNGTCSRLLAEYAVEAGLSPAVDVVPDEDASELFRRAVASSIAAHMARLEPAAGRLNRFGGGAGRDSLPDWRDDVRRVAELARTGRIAPPALRRCGEANWKAYGDMLGAASPSVDAAVLFREAKKAIPSLEAVADPTKKTQAVLDALRNFLRFEGREPAWGEWVRLAKLDPGKDGRSAVADIPELAGRWLRHPLLHADVRTVIVGVFSCAADALEQYREYKTRHGLMDFVDQEERTLRLLEENESFRASLKERLSLILVDEFQDTSPMQLALFLELHRLVGASTWVGDPKQAIYGFRGTDPALMNEVVARVDVAGALEFSRRSREKLVAFVNAVFTRVFHETPAERVRLLIPGDRKDRGEAEGGVIESWLLNGGNADNAATSLAVALSTHLKRNPRLRPSDIAVLCRRNDDCGAVAAALEAAGIRASTAQGELASAPACRLALAALRYLRDDGDTLAMAELVKLTPGRPDAAAWLRDAIEDGGATCAKWRKEPLFRRLDAARPELRHWTPLEALEFAIGASDAPSAAKVLPNTGLSLANLDKLRLVCAQYLDQCRARRTAAGVAGFLAYLDEKCPGQAEGLDEQAVRVLTYHKSKGLEWPAVVLYNLDAKSRAGAFDMRSGLEGDFDPAQPLRGGTIHFWPNPIPGKQKSDELDALVASRPEHAAAIGRERAERRRVLYVGMTRARDTLILAVRKKPAKSGASLLTSWLDELSDASGAPLVKLPVNNEKNAREQTHALRIGTDAVDVVVRDYCGDILPERLSRLEAPAFIAPPAEPIERLPARRVPSQLEAGDAVRGSAEVSLAADFQARVAVKGRPDFGRLGDAVHGFLGMDKRGLKNAALLAAAGDVLERFGVAGALTPADLAGIQERFDDFIRGGYPGAKLRREWPVAWKNGRNQLLQGWIDLLLEMPDGFVIIDHKSYPGDDAEGRVREYAPQLAAYRHAVEKATGKKVAALLVHMPVLGRVYALTGLKESGDEPWL